MYLYNSHTHILTGSTSEIVQTEGEILNTWNSVGIHPFNVSQVIENELEEVLISQVNQWTIAIGEIGVDGLIEDDLKRQYIFFIEQCKLAEILGLPVIVHCVRAWYLVLKAYKELNPKRNWVFHGFNKKNLLSQVLKCEKIMLSLGASIVVKEDSSSWIKEIPLDRLLLETDAAHLTIDLVYDAAARIYEIPMEELKNRIEINFQNTFNKWQIG